MGKSYKGDKKWGPKKGKNPKFNPRREERQKIRRQREKELSDTVDKTLHHEETDWWEEYERLRDNKLK